MIVITQMIIIIATTIVISNWYFICVVFFFMYFVDLFQRIKSAGLRLDKGWILVIIEITNVIRAIEI